VSGEIESLFNKRCQEMTMNQQLKEAALGEYIDECTEMLERITQKMTGLEAGSAGSDVLAGIYRDMHTIKGSSQLFGFAQLGQLAHAMETCLDLVRKGTVKLLPALVDGLFAGVDVISELLQGVRSNKKEPDVRGKLEILLPKLIEIAETSMTGAGPMVKHYLLADENLAKPQERVGPVYDKKPIMTDHLQSKVTEQDSVSKQPSSGPSMSEENLGFGIFDDTPATPAKVASSATGAALGTAIPVVTDTERKTDDSSRKADFKTEIKAASVEDQQAETIRVHVSLLDNLMNLVGELVLIRNQLLQHAKNNDADTEFGKMGQRLNVLTAELQNEVMKTRMHPIGNVLTKFTRVVRDLGRELGKKIDLEILGAETELDKTIIEAVKDPLMHIVRNAIDHGIETVDERRRSGKSETARVTLNAHHESGQVIIEIKDDGRGLDRHKIGAKAVEKGLVSAEQLNRMTDREVHFLIFASGFSTAASVSNISGRGVGMDVVRTNVEKIGGVVDLVSTLGVGTTIRLKIPLTLAIVPALVVRAMGQRFAIPQSKLVELLRIEGEDGGSERIEFLQGRPVLRLRGHLLPLVHLTEILSRSKGAESARAWSQVGGAKRDRSSGEMDDAIKVVVLNADSFQFGLIVDEIEDSADIVVKSMSQFLKDLTLFSGATIMGDGAVALTIDVMGISESARSTKESGDAKGISAANDFAKKGTENLEMAEFLLVDVGAPGSYAIPLTVVSRLEEFEASRFELSGEQRVVRYRDALLPIYSLPDFLELPFEKNKTPKEKVAIVVLRRGDHLYGIEVEEIQDVVSMPARIDESVRDRPGILGTLLTNERVLVVVDVFGMLDAIKQSMAEASGIIAAPEQSKSGDSRIGMRRKHHVLLVEDSAFFRNYVRQILLESGYLVTAACDGAEGFTVLENAPAGHFSLILSDIEMPVMDGLELARKVREVKSFDKIPMVAITTRFSNSDIERGMTAGFQRYLEKLNAEKLLTELDALLCEPAAGKEIRRAG
jgi:two-component system, chemotaxis family, sensor kinase CheA